MSTILYRVKPFHLLMTKVDFLSLWVVVEQHAPLNVVQVYLKKAKQIDSVCFLSGVTAAEFKMQNGSTTQQSESVYFWQILRDKLRRLYCHHVKSPEQLLMKSGLLQNKVGETSTLCTLMEGNMFWNMVAMSLICMPSEPKLLRMRRGWWVNCCLCIRCFFSVETTSFEREYWGGVERKGWGKSYKPLNDSCAVSRSTMHLLLFT